MTFLSIPFFLLFLIVLVGVRICPKTETRHWILLIASCIFYGYWDLRFLCLMMLLILIVYVLSLRIEACREQPVRTRVYMAAGVIVALGILGFFKYWNFFMESFCKILGIRNAGTLSVILPVGISFYTFQAMSYLIDVYRGKLQARSSFLKVALYISFFPQLVAGPIVRSTDFLPQLDEDRELSLKGLEEGIQIFLFGAFKKAVIADRMAVCVDCVFGAYGAFDGLTLMVAALAYAIQIYCDFSGYSDMAIGAAKMLGYDLCRNFNLPYLASNPSDFWRRWHISLSEWFRDYVYIPLGGSRKGSLRTYWNLFLTMLLSGLWHGASWSFVLWGAYHGLASCLHRAVSTRKKSEGKKTNCFFSRALSITATFFYVVVGWIFFRAQTIEDAFQIIRRIVTLAPGIRYVYVFVPVYAVLIAAASLWAYCRNNKEGYYPVQKLNSFSAKVAVGILFWLILAFFYPGDNAFIYFQF